MCVFFFISPTCRATKSGADPAARLLAGPQPRPHLARRLSSRGRAGHPGDAHDPADVSLVARHVRRVARARDQARVVGRCESGRVGRRRAGAGRLCRAGAPARSLSRLRVSLTDQLLISLSPARRTASSSRSRSPSSRSAPRPSSSPRSRSRPSRRPAPHLSSSRARRSTSRQPSPSRSSPSRTGRRSRCSCRRGREGGRSGLLR